MGPGGAWWESAYWSGGVRYVGAASLICGFCMERGKVSTDTGVFASLWGGVPRGRAVSGRNREPLSTDAVLAGGPARSSAEAPVMGVERRGRLIRRFVSASNQATVWEETRVSKSEPEDKSVQIPKQLVWEAYRRAAQHKAAGRGGGEFLTNF